MQTKIEKQAQNWGAVQTEWNWDRVGAGDSSVAEPAP